MSAGEGEPSRRLARQPAARSHPAPLRAGGWGLQALLLGLAVVLGLLIGYSLQGRVPEGSLEAEARAVARLLTCPVCDGQSVAESNSGVAAQIRQEVGQMLAEGKSRQEILDHYVAEYGVWILASPPRGGLFTLVWAIPGAALLLGALFGWRWVRRGSGGGAP